MYDFGACPRCQMEIPSERLRESVIICSHCGHTTNQKQTQLEKKAEKRYVTLVTSLCAVLTMAFVLVVQWDNHVMEALPLKAKQMMGAASAGDLTRLREICKDRKNLECQVEVTQQLTRVDNEAFAELGKMQYLMGKHREAMRSFSKYFDNGGLSLDASYHYARSLEKDGQVEQAAKYYEDVIAGKPDTLQITVTKNYIKMLMEYNRKQQAKNVLANIRKRGSNTTDFMDPVFKELERSVQ